MNKHNFKVGQVYTGKERFSYLNTGRPFTVMVVDPDRGLQRTSSDGEFQDSWVSFEAAAEMWELVRDVPEEPKTEGAYDPEGLNKIIDDLKKQLHDAKLAEGLALTGREQAEETLEQAKDQIVGLQNKLIDKENEVDRLENELEASGKETDRANETANKFYRETKVLQTKIKELEDAVKFERNRLTSALEVADNAASGIGAMSRTFHVMADLVQRIESKLDR